MPARVPDRPPPPPPVQRLRLRYAKRGRLRFASHRDFQRALERALARAGVPMAYSAGFSPHPKISYAGAAPTGAASEAEYVEIAVTEPVDPARLARDLDACLPPGLDVLEAVTALGGSLAERLEASAWHVVLPGLSPAAVSRAVAAFLATPSLPVERLLKEGRRTLDARGPVVALSCRAPADPRGADRGQEHPCAILDLVVRHGTPAVRPDDVLAGLRSVADFEWPASAPARATRLAQGSLTDDGRLSDPLASDRVPAPSGGGFGPAPRPAGVAGAPPSR